MKDKVLIWTVFTTGVVLVLFSWMVVMVAHNETIAIHRESIQSHNERDNIQDIQIEILRTQVNQLPSNRYVKKSLR